MRDVKQTVVSQYANSPTIRQLIDSMNGYIDPATDFKNFYDYVWNVDTAVGFGLDILGRVVGIDRNLTIPDVNKLAFGFKEGISYQPFGQAPFYDGGPNTTTYALADADYRKLILVKALSNISICSASSINQQLRNLFPGRGRCYVNDFRNMTLRFTFEFELQPFELAIILQSGAVTRPAGVQSAILEVVAASTFGFMEAGGQPFGSGVFFNQ